MWEEVKLTTLNHGGETQANLRGTAVLKPCHVRVTPSPLGLWGGLGGPGS